MRKIWKQKIIVETVIGLMISGFGCYASQTDNMRYFSVNFTNHNRTAIYELGNAYEQKEGRNSLITAGASIGKRLPISRNFRLGMPISFNYGTVKDDTLSSIRLANGTVPDEVILKSDFYEFGISPELQYKMPFVNRSLFYVLAGGGMHYVKMQEKEWYGNIQIIDSYLEKYSGLRWSICCGAGMDLGINRHLAFGAQYQFRYWHPVKGNTNRDLFPLGNVIYKEKFLSQTISVLFLFK